MPVIWVARVCVLARSRSSTCSGSSRSTGHAAQRQRQRRAFAAEAVQQPLDACGAGLRALVRAVDDDLDDRGLAALQRGFEILRDHDDRVGDLRLAQLHLEVDRCGLDDVGLAFDEVLQARRVLDADDVDLALLGA